MEMITRFFKSMPATISLVVINVAVFGWMIYHYDTPDPSLWSLRLLDHGALFNPYTLDDEWYRMFTHMFHHRSWLHIICNMYALITVGIDIEHRVGTKKFIAVYLIGGIGAALTSLYFNLFMIGVGASGAIFALFGFALIVEIARHRDQMTALIINFVVFVAINYFIGEYVNADHAAHFGGAVCGIVLGIFAITIKTSIIPDAIISILMIGVFFSLPRFQVRYFNFFQKVLEAQDSSNYVLRNSSSMSDDKFLEEYRRVNTKWDTAMQMLDAQQYIPGELASDTFKIRRVVKYNKAEADYRSTMIEKESYIYFDSMGIAADSLRKYLTLRYVLSMKYTPPRDTTGKPEGPPLKPVKIWYDSNWVEIPYPPAAYFRIGQRDTLGLWQGPLVDYYRTGIPQMKGTYKDDTKNGIFIYYRENGGYSAAGIYDNDQRVGKWETFHPNGKIETEVYYRDRYFLKSYWDSTGVQMVKDGNGKETHRYSNGVVASEGEIVDGYQQGYWYGKHADGQMYFEENYNRGRLINGRSRSKSGKTAIYDETVFFAMPEVGARKYIEYVRSQVEPKGLGRVRLSFRVTVDGQIMDFKVEESVSKELDLRAKQIVLNGPRWLPAKLHGLEPTDGYGFVVVEF